VWGIVVGLGVAMALEPLPVLAVVLLLAVSDGLRKAWAFVLGEFLVVFAIAAASVALQIGTSRGSASAAASWVTIAAGVFLMAAGARWALQRRRGVEAARPGWMRRLDRMQPWPAFLLGAFIPPYMIAVAAGAHIVGSHPGSAQAIAGVVVFTGIGLSTVYTPILLAQFAPERSGPARERTRGWLEANWRIVVIALLLAVGGLLVAKGVLALA
jgi:hypothetical protein